MPKHSRLTGLILVAAFALPVTLAGQAIETAGEVIQTTVSMSGGATSLELELASGRTLKVQLADGLVYVDGAEVGRYAAGGSLESGWRGLLDGIAEGNWTDAWASFLERDYAAADAEAVAEIMPVLAPLLAAEAAELAQQTVEATLNAAEVTDEAIAAEIAQEIADAINTELVVGGLVVELTEVDGIASSLSRIGLAPELSRVLNGDLETPVRIVLDADEYTLPEEARLEEMLILVQTDAVVAGTIASNVVVAEGSLLITPTGRIDGDVIAIDATVHNQGTILGDLREAANFAPVIAPMVRPSLSVVRYRPSFMDKLAGGFGSLAKTIAMYVLFGFLGAVIVYFFRGHLETVSDTVSFSFGRSFLAGLAAEVLFLPIGLVLTVLIVTAIAVPFYIIGFGLLSLLGYISVAHAAGENLTRHRFTWPNRMRRSNSYYYVLNGLGVLLALFAGAAITQMASPLLGWAQGLLIASAWILTWVASTAGLGAALLSRAGTRRTYARPYRVPELAADSLARDFSSSHIERRTTARRTRREGNDET
jgi:hypothetical protein